MSALPVCMSVILGGILIALAVILPVIPTVWKTIALAHDWLCRICLVLGIAGVMMWVLAILFTMGCVPW